MVDHDFYAGFSFVLEKATGNSSPSESVRVITADTAKNTCIGKQITRFGKIDNIQRLNSGFA